VPAQPARRSERKPSEFGVKRVIEPSAGHGIGTTVSERIKHSADIYSFLFAQRG